MGSYIGGVSMNVNDENIFETFGHFSEADSEKSDDEKSRPESSQSKQSSIRSSKSRSSRGSSRRSKALVMIFNAGDLTHGEIPVVNFTQGRTFDILN